MSVHGFTNFFSDLIFVDCLLTEILVFKEARAEPVPQAPKFSEITIMVLVPNLLT